MQILSGKTMKTMAMSRNAVRLGLLEIQFCHNRNKLKRKQKKKKKENIFCKDFKKYLVFSFNAFLLHPINADIALVSQDTSFKNIKNLAIYVYMLYESLACCIFSVRTNQC